jgi:6-phosphogluconate dehydrogenase
MDIAVIGLGRMGLNIARRLLKGGIGVVAYDVDSTALRAAEQAGARTSVTLQDAVRQLKRPRAVWVMVPAGKVTEAAIRTLGRLLASGDVLIDGGNSNYRESQRRARALQRRGIDFLDVGTSGGIWGLGQGYSLMVGGRPEAAERMRPVFQALAPAADKGWAYMGPSGSGHFVKMVHNGIEYGVMQAFAEGFELLRAKDEFGLDLHRIAETWRHGSVVRSWLLDLISSALAEDVDLSSVPAWVPDSGEGRWTVNEAVELGVPAPVITLALQMRFASRSENSYAAKMLAAMRHKFGGHPMKRRKD